MILSSRMENSSAHGLPNIHRSSRLFPRLVWSVLFLGGIGIIVWQVVTIFQTYFAFDYVVSLEVKFNRSQSFPAITLCNMNPVMKTKLEQSDDSFRRLFDTSFVPIHHGGHGPPGPHGNLPPPNPPAGGHRQDHPNRGIFEDPRDVITTHGEAIILCTFSGHCLLCRFNTQTCR